MMEFKGYTCIFLSLLLFAIIPSISAGGCFDAISGCQYYPDYSCRAPYIGWALNKCRRTCNLCHYLPRGQGNCFDKKPNCADFIAQDDNFCQNEFKPFAITNCKWSCNFCSYTGNRGMMFLDALTKENEKVSLKPDLCEDKLKNCSSFPDSACESPDWSVNNCQKKCNLCEETPISCVDKLTTCDPLMCTGDYKSWVRLYCPVTCNFCEASTTPQPPTEIALPSTSLSPVQNFDDKVAFCQDLDSGGCYSVPDTKCLDKMWAIPRCKKRCKICGSVAEKCVDTGDCSEFGFSVLCTGYYRHWAKQYCPVTCGYCDPKQ